MHILIVVQLRENYAAHAWDGKGACPQGWKNKGAQYYALRNVASSDVPTILAGTAPIVKEVLDLVCFKSDYFEASLCSISAHESLEGLLPSWDAPIVMSKLKSGWRGTQVNNVDAYSMLPAFVKQERTTYLFNGGKNPDVEKQYLLKDGRFMDYNALVAEAKRVSR